MKSSSSLWFVFLFALLTSRTLGCSAGQYTDSTGNCQNCPSWMLCTDCQLDLTKITSVVCTTCSSVTYPEISSTIGNCGKCIDNNYDDGTACQTCPSTDPICTGLCGSAAVLGNLLSINLSARTETNYCLSCQAGYTPNLFDGVCYATCAEGTYMITDGTCSDCPGSMGCSQCYQDTNYSNNVKCTACTNGLYSPSVILGYCQLCPDGKYTDSNGVCQNCPSWLQCSTCKLDGTKTSGFICMTCSGSLTISVITGACFPCADGQYQQADLTCATCPVDSNCDGVCGLASFYGHLVNIDMSANTGGSYCLKCNSGYTTNLNDGVCYTTCTSGNYMQNTGACAACTGNLACSTCTQDPNYPNSIKCVVCLAGGQTPDPSLGSCKICPDGQYQGIDSVCATCPSYLRCSTCSYDATTVSSILCTVCQSGSLQVNTATGGCFECVQGEYYAADSTCQTCPTVDVQCDSVCGPQTVLGGLYKVDLSSYSLLNSCLKCKTGHSPNLENGQCFDTCPTGQYLTSLGYCAACPSWMGCATCQQDPNYFLKVKCLTCTTGGESPTAKLGFCHNCPDGQYSNSENTCTTCPATDTHCNGICGSTTQVGNIYSISLAVQTLTYSNCLLCSSGYTLNYADGICYTSCQSDQYMKTDGTCALCPVNMGCNQCQQNPNFPLSVVCTSCKSMNSLISASTGFCLLCNDGSYYKTSILACAACPTDAQCQSLCGSLQMLGTLKSKNFDSFTSSSAFCLKCNNLYTTNLVTGLCQSNCASGSYMNSAGTCTTPCPAWMNCATCSQTLLYIGNVQCDACSDSNVLSISFGVCLPCIDGQYSSDSCVNCPTTDTNCNNLCGTPTTLGNIVGISLTSIVSATPFCLKCLSGYQVNLVTGLCVAACDIAQGKYLLSDGTCVSCPTWMLCSTCTQDPNFPNSVKCLTCSQASATVSVKFGYCSTCTDSFYLGGAGCVACPSTDTYCNGVCGSHLILANMININLGMMNPAGPYCLQAKTSYTINLYNGICYATCTSTQYMKSDGTCASCPTWMECATCTQDPNYLFSVRCLTCTLDTNVISAKFGYCTKCIDTKYYTTSCVNCPQTDAYCNGVCGLKAELSSLQSVDLSAITAADPFCFECAASYSLNFYDGKCYSSCSSGQYMLADGTCAACPSYMDCTTCTQDPKLKIKVKCLACATGGYTVSAKLGICQKCADGQYLNSGDTCVACPANTNCDSVCGTPVMLGNLVSIGLTTVSATPYCLQCTSSYTVNLADGRCETTCTSGNYMTAAGACTPCPPAITSCVTCTQDPTRSPAVKCFNQCSAGQFLSDDDNCYACPSWMNCASCKFDASYPLKVKCLTCTTGTDIISPKFGACMKCSDSYYLSYTNICKSCPSTLDSNCNHFCGYSDLLLKIYNCSNTAAVVNNNIFCLSCKTNYAPNLFDGKCYLACPSGKYMLKDSTCLTCPSWMQCQTCQQDPSFLYGVRCLTCVSGSLILSMKLGICQSCADGEYLSDSTCTNCPTTDIRCNSQCETKSILGRLNGVNFDQYSTVTPVCHQCVSNYQVNILTGVCAAACSTGYYMLQSGACEACPSWMSCYQCGQDPNYKFSVKCTACSINGYVISAKLGVCLPCPDGYYLIMNTCIPCPSTDINCNSLCGTAMLFGKYYSIDVSASVSSNPYCLECQSNHVTNLNDGMCYIKCTSTQYMNIDGGCVDCPTKMGCATCTFDFSAPFQVRCLSCVNSAFSISTYFGICTNCPDGQYLTSASTCATCPTTDPFCQGMCGRQEIATYLLDLQLDTSDQELVYCLSCYSGQEINPNNGKCYNACFDGQYMGTDGICYDCPTKLGCKSCSLLKTKYEGQPFCTECLNFLETVNTTSGNCTSLVNALYKNTTTIKINEAIKQIVFGSIVWTLLLVFIWN